MAEAAAEAEAGAEATTKQSKMFGMQRYRGTTNYAAAASHELRAEQQSRAACAMCHQPQAKQSHATSLALPYPKATLPPFPTAGQLPTRTAVETKGLSLVN